MKSSIRVAALTTNKIAKLKKYNFYLLKRFPGNPVPLKEGLNPGGIGEICGNGKEDGGRGM